MATKKAPRTRVEDYMRTPEAMEYVGVSRRTLNRWHQQGLIDRYRLGNGPALWRRDDLDRLVRRDGAA